MAKPVSNVLRGVYSPNFTTNKDDLHLVLFYFVCETDTLT